MSVAGGLNGMLNVLLATVEPGQEVVISDPIYAGLVNRVRLAGGVPRHVVRSRRSTAGRSTRVSCAAASDRGRAAVLMMSPAMPTGAVLGRRALGGASPRPSRRHGAWVI